MEILSCVKLLGILVKVDPVSGIVDVFDCLVSFPFYRNPIGSSLLMRPPRYSLYFLWKIVQIPCVKVNLLSIFKEDFEGSQLVKSSACVKPATKLEDYSVKGHSPKYKYCTGQLL